MGFNFLSRRASYYCDTPFLGIRLNRFLGLYFYAGHLRRRLRQLSVLLCDEQLIAACHHGRHPNVVQKVPAGGAKKRTANEKGRIILSLKTAAERASV